MELKDAMCIVGTTGDIEQANTNEDTAQQDAFLNMDMYRIEQVVRNLVTNAVGTLLFSSTSDR